MQDVSNWINEAELGNLSLEVLDYVDRISEVFGRIDDCMNRLPNCYRGTGCIELRSRYKELAKSYPVIKNNIKSYSEDFLVLIKKMREGDQDLKTLATSYADDMHENARLANINSIIK